MTPKQIDKIRVAYLRQLRYAYLASLHGRYAINTLRWLWPPSHENDEAKLVAQVETAAHFGILALKAEGKW